MSDASNGLSLYNTLTRAKEPFVPIDPKNVRTVEVDVRGNYMMAKRMMPLDQIVNQLAFEHSRNPALLVYIRADESGPYRYVAAILNRLEAARIDQVSLRTQPPGR